MVRHMPVSSLCTPTVLPHLKQQYACNETADRPREPQFFLLCTIDAEPDVNGAAK
jgi:hypothetical protein